MIGNRIKELRTRKGLTQVQLSSQIAISQSFLAQIECGKRELKWEMAKKIAEALEVSLADLDAHSVFPIQRKRGF